MPQTKVIRISNNPAGNDLAPLQDSSLEIEKKKTGKSKIKIRLATRANDFKKEKMNQARV